MEGIIGPRVEICITSGLPIVVVPFLQKQCLYQKKAKGMDSPKIYSPSQWKPVQACKLLQFTERDIGPTMEICVYSGLLIVMVTCLHQSNVYIKRKLRGWRVKKCIPLVGVKTELTCVGLQTTKVHGGHYNAENGNLHKFGSTRGMERP